MEKEDLVNLFQAFLDENGMWFTFVCWLEEREQKEPTDIGFSSND